jgi:MFS family permease
MTLGTVWILPFIQIEDPLQCALIVASVFVFVSGGWAAGDVSLAAFIQSSLSDLPSGEHDISPLGSVMAFLYSSYILFYAVMSPILGKLLDDFRKEENVRGGLLWVSVGFSIAAVIIMASTFIPKMSK